MKVFKTASCGILIFLFLSSCKVAPTYKDAEIEDRIKVLSKKEYGVENILVKRVGKTLGIYLPLEGLFDKNLQIKKDILKKIEGLFFISSRVCLSSDAKIDFLKLIYVDTKLLGLELSILQYIEDIKRLQAIDISRGEYFKRIQQDIRFNPSVLAEIVVKLFFENFGKERSSKLIKDYFLKDIKFPRYLKNEHALKIKYIHSLQITKEKALVYVEAYGKKQYNLLFLINIKDIQSLREIILLYTLLTKEKPLKNIFPIIEDVYPLKIANKIYSFPSEYKKFAHIDKWRRDFYLEEVRLPEFMAAQLKNRLIADFDGNKNLKKAFLVKNINVEFKDNSQRTFEIKIEIDKLLQLSHSIEDIILKIVSQQFYSYGFRDFDSIKIIDVIEESEVIVNKKELDRYRKIAFRFKS